MYQKILPREQKDFIDWQKIFGNLISDKGLISRMYRELPILNGNYKTISFKNGKQFNRKEISFHPHGGATIKAKQN